MPISESLPIVNLIPVIENFLKHIYDFICAINCTHKLTCVCLCMCVQSHTTQGSVCLKFSCFTSSFNNNQYPIIKANCFNLKKIYIKVY